MSLPRREFLRRGAAAGLGALPLGAVQAQAGGGPGVRRYVALGRTGIHMADVAFGSSSSADPELVRHALDRGVNYFDTAESYRSGNAEAAIGEGLAGVRERVYIASKTKARAGDRAQDMMSALEASLRRLRTDYVDVYFNHAVNDVEHMRNDAWQEFTARALRDGKIRFRGVSGHGSHLAEVIEYALDNDLADVLLCAFNFGQDPDLYDRLRHTFHWAALQPALPPLLARARSRGVGVIAMKTLMGAKLNDLGAYTRAGASFSQAALRWVLASGYADAALISMTSRERIDEYLGASGGEAPERAARELLERHLLSQSTQWCRPACGACESSCPAGVAVSEVLRTRMYERSYGDRTLALAGYAELGAGASPCLACNGAPCAGACPYGLPIAHLTRDAAARLGARTRS